jgi:hypothetical protein
MDEFMQRLQGWLAEQNEVQSVESDTWGMVAILPAHDLIITLAAPQENGPSTITGR